MLTREQEKDLGQRARAGCESARNELVEANLGFVIRVAQEYRYLGVPFEDLLNEGNLGLLEAARRYDKQKGTKFITYAMWWIRKYILQAIGENSSLIRVPDYRRRMARQDPDSDDGSTRTTMISLTGKPDERREALGDRLIDTRRASAEELVLQEEVDTVVEQALRSLTLRERTVIIQRYGLDGSGVRKLTDIGNQMGLSRERVRQIEKQATNRLRKVVERRMVASPAKTPRPMQREALPVSSAPRRT